MLGEHQFQTFELESGSGSRHAEEDDAGVGMAVPHDELTEVSVVGDEDAPLTVGDGEDFFVRKGSGVLAGDGSDVMTACFEPARQAKLSALV